MARDKTTPHPLKRNYYTPRWAGSSGATTVVQSGHSVVDPARLVSQRAWEGGNGGLERIVGCASIYERSGCGRSLA
jgi:hypothetical protein